MSDTPAAPSGKRWYVVHAYSGMEKSVQRALQERIERAGMTDQFGQILVPTEEVVEVKGGHKSVTERRFFPGYVLVEMEMTDETWHLVKKHRKSDRLCWRSAKSPKPDLSPRGGKDHVADAGRRRKATAKDAFRGRRDGSRQGRSVHRLQRQRRGSELREVARPSVGDDFRSVYTRRAGIWPSRKGLKAFALPSRSGLTARARFALTVRLMAVEERQ